jgi:hypothetical protein
MQGMVQSVESQSKRYWISSKAIMPIVRSEQRPDKQFSIFACVVAEQCSEPERRIGRILKSEVPGRRRVTLVVSCKYYSFPCFTEEQDNEEFLVRHLPHGFGARIDRAATGAGKIAN